MPPKEELVQSWLRKAKHDLIVGQRSLSEEPLIPDLAAYHAQQVVEKALKAMLVLREIEPPHTHSIEVLLARCGSIDPRLDKLAPACASLTDYAVTGRYPDEDEPSVDEARQALEIASQVFDVIVEVLPKDVHP